MSTKDYKTCRLLGKGSYGSVYKVTRKKDGLDYAMKEVECRDLNQKEKYVLSFPLFLQQAHSFHSRNTPLLVFALPNAK